jgi:hypothetical protein
MAMTDSFYIYLASNSGDFPNNTQSSFRVRLPMNLDLTELKKACSVPYGYIMYDAHPSVDDRDRLRGCILDVPQHVYMDNSYL